MADPRPTLKFVVLRHEGVEPPHFDFLFETSQGSELTSVRCREWPPASPTPLHRRPDHRRLYLNYEGAISGNRGTVRRIAAGTCNIEPEGTDLLLVTLLPSGEKVRVHRSLQHQGQA